MITIEDKRENHFVQYGELRYGQCFIYSESLCYETERGAIELKTGYAVDMDREDLVVPVNVKAVIE